VINPVPTHISCTLGRLVLLASLVQRVTGISEEPLLRYTSAKAASLGGLSYPKFGSLVRNGSNARPQHDILIKSQAAHERAYKAICGEDGNKSTAAICRLPRDQFLAIHKSMQTRLRTQSTPHTQHARVKFARRSAYDVDDPLVKSAHPVNRTHITVFLHLSKSGGTTVCHLAKLQPRVNLADFQWKHNCNLPRESYEQGANYDWRVPLLTSCKDIYAYNRQHDSDCMHLETAFTPGIRRCPNVTYWALFRDPMERLLSHMNHWSISAARVSAILDGSVKPQADKWPSQPGAFNNIYTRFLLGRDAFLLPVGAINQTHEVPHSHTTFLHMLKLA